MLLVLYQIQGWLIQFHPNRRGGEKSQQNLFIPHLDSSFSHQNLAPETQDIQLNI